MKYICKVFSLLVVSVLETSCMSTRLSPLEKVEKELRGVYVSWFRADNWDIKEFADCMNVIVRHSKGKTNILISDELVKKTAGVEKYNEEADKLISEFILKYDVGKGKEKIEYKGIFVGQWSLWEVLDQITRTQRMCLKVEDGNAVIYRFGGFECRLIDVGSDFIRQTAIVEETEESFINKMTKSYPIIFMTRRVSADKHLVLVISTPQGFKSLNSLIERWDYTGDRVIK